MKPVTTMPIKNYASIGRCFFCLNEYGSSDLTDEHIIPRALNGSFILKKGVCVECARYGNKTFEQPALNADFLVPRLMLELRRRSKSEKKLPLVALGNHPEDTSAEAFKIELQAAMYPPLVTLIMIPVAGLLAGVERSGDLKTMQTMTYRIPRNLGGELFSSVSTRHMHFHTAFALTLAKIAYCYAVGELGLGGFDGANIRDLIMGRRDDTYNFIGGQSKPEFFREDTLHGLYIRTRGAFVTVVVHLFASCKMKPYEVVVGKAIA